MTLRRVALGVVAALLVAAAVTVLVVRTSGGTTPDVAPSSRAPSSTIPSATPSAASPSPTPAAVPHAVVALGDSVPAGNVCGCRPFPEVYGTLLSQRTGAPVSVDNLAVGGLDTSGLIAQLGRPNYQAAVRRSDIVLITIGANDFGDHHDQVVTGRCGTGNADCVADEVTALRAHLTTVLDRIRALRGTAPTTILVTGYWNVFQDGDVARRDVGEAGLQASLRLTDRANAVIQSVSAAEGAHYVDLFTAFNSTGQDITGLMAGDGDHPNAAGHRLIAEALIDAGLPRVT